MPTRQELIESTFAALDRHICSASVAQVGGFPPPPLPITSYFGGRFAGRPGEDWPLEEGQPMLPLLQVRTDELPYRPSALEGISLLNVFINPKSFPIGAPAESGCGWLIRCYSSLNDLVRLPQRTESRVRPFPIRWRRSDAEAPTWDEAWRLQDLTEFNKLHDSTDLFHDRYTQHSFTKVGGWPAYTQPSPELDGYVFQIGSEEKANWVWADNGAGYFYYRTGAWWLHWDCY